MSDLGYMEKLLDGVEVEWIDIKDLCDVITTGKLNANAMEDDGIYPFFTCNEYPYKINSYAFDLEAILISGNGSQVGHLNYYNGKFNAYQRTYVIGDFKDNVKVMYFFYYLNHTLKNYITKNSRKGSVPYITMPMLENFKIPIPSLNVQAEIVRILDVFTELTAELTAELVARKQQYEYYRDQLLTFKEGEVDWKALGSLAENLDSKRKPITSGLRESGSIPYYGASGIVDYVKDYIFDGDYLLISEDGANLTARNTPIAFSISGKNWVNNHAHVLKFETYAERRYVEYYLNSIELTPYISGAAQPKLNQKNLNSIKIPSPSLKEQERIVAILDKFDTLTTSLTEGLPREIELRQQQYEYYRELLLSFPKAEVADHD